jgi:hypothetical protein
MAVRKNQSILTAVLLAAALSMATGNFGSLSAHVQEAYAVSGNLDASTCTGADNTWDDGNDTCMVGGTLEADRAGTLTIPSGTTLAVGSMGSLVAGSSSIVVAENGTINNEGAIQLSQISFTNNGTINNEGAIHIGNGFLRNNPEGSINNERDGVIDSIGDFFNSGTINNKGTINAGHMDNSDSGIINNEGTITGPRSAFTGAIPTSGNAIEYLDSPPAYSMSINSADLSGNPINGVWTTIRSESRPDVDSFTPILIYGDLGVEYVITAADYAGRIFHHWEDGSTERTRTINFANGTTITAYFDTGDSVRGFAPMTYTGADEQPDLTVNATTLDGSRTLHMWTIIDPQSRDESGTTYKVYASNYKDRIFDHWEDGSTSRIRTLTIDEATTITAYYQTG